MLDVVMFFALAATRDVTQHKILYELPTALCATLSDETCRILVGFTGSEAG
jgi:hypothetical protein